MPHSTEVTDYQEPDPQVIRLWQSMLNAAQGKCDVPPTHHIIPYQVSYSLRYDDGLTIKLGDVNLIGSEGENSDMELSNASRLYDIGQGGPGTEDCRFESKATRILSAKSPRVDANSPLSVDSITMHVKDPDMKALCIMGGESMGYFVPYIELTITRIDASEEGPNARSGRDRPDSTPDVTTSAMSPRQGSGSYSYNTVIKVDSHTTAPIADAEDFARFFDAKQPASPDLSEEEKHNVGPWESRWKARLSVNMEPERAALNQFRINFGWVEPTADGNWTEISKPWEEATDTAQAE